MEMLRAISGTEFYSRESKDVFDNAIKRSIDMHHTLGTDDLVAALIENPVCELFFESNSVDIALLKERLMQVRNYSGDEIAGQHPEDAEELRILKDILTDAHLGPDNRNRNITPERMLYCLLVGETGLGRLVLGEVLHETDTTGDDPEILIGNIYLNLQDLEATRTDI